MTDVFNLRTLELRQRDDPGHAFHSRHLGGVVKSELTGFAVYELAAGERHWPYHYELIHEEWLFVIEGELVLRTPGGETTLRAGDVTFFPLGPDGAHQMRNDSAAPVRFAMPSSAGEGYIAIRPDSNTAYIEGVGFEQIVPLDVSLEYWDREP